MAFIARDRLGVKPLFFAELPDGHLIVGSELKSLLVHGALARDIDPLAVEEYFAFGYVPEPRTIFSSAAKLPPAHSLTVRRGAPLPAPREYWDVAFTQSSTLSAEQASAELIERLRESRSAAHDLRSTAGRFPLWWCRFQRGRRDDGGNFGDAY